MIPIEAKRTIPFSPPDITEEDIAEVSDALRSGWITTGPRTKELERLLADSCHAGGAAALSSCTAALECALRVLGVGPGDEVITSAYTYTASASCICHVGATPVLCDVAPESYEVDFDQIGSCITERTRAIIPVDIAGRMVDYPKLFDALASAVPESGWAPSQKETLGAQAERRLMRPVVIADAAHSLGATHDGMPSGSLADLTAFSFHAVKNLTTAEGGALVWREGLFDDAELYRQLMLWSLHGQTKDALSKTRVSAWEYDIAFPGHKCNMTDVQAALGLSQLRRYPDLLDRRHQIVSRYEDGLADLPLDIMSHCSQAGEAPFRSSAHLMLVRLEGKDAAFRNALIEKLGEAGVSANVHYKPLPLLTAYRNLGFRIDDFPNALAQYHNEVTLPLHTCLSDEDVDYVIEAVHDAYRALESH